MNQIPEEFDWVNARERCTPLDVLHDLEVKVEKDVEKRNALLSESEKQYEVKFKFSSDLNQFFVEVERSTERVERVRFRPLVDGIEVTYLESETSFIGTLTLSNDGQCRLQVGDIEYNFWQFRKAALEQVFFSLVKEHGR
jgi:hypothetical protein